MYQVIRYYRQIQSDLTIPAGIRYPTTWDPASKSSEITLSNNNLTAAKNTGGTNANTTRSYKGNSAGKFYCEFGPLVEEFAQDVGIGLINANHVMQSGTLASLIGGDTNNSVAIYSDGSVYINHVVVSSTGLTWANGDGSKWGMAVDLDAKLIWFRKNAGNWNGSGAANPATGAGGISFAGMNLVAPYYVGAGAITDVVFPDSVTVNFGATAYANAAPSGFGNWLDG
jgi:hypothetical protein